MNDFTKSPQQIIVDMLNAANGTFLKPEQLIFGIPQVNNDPGAKRNTKLVISGVAEQGVEGSIEIQYNRVHIDTVPGVRSRTFERGARKDLSELVPLINGRYAINLTAEEYIDAPLPATLVGELPMLATSLVFTGTLNYALDTEDAGSLPSPYVADGVPDWELPPGAPVGVTVKAGTDAGLTFTVNGQPWPIEYTDTGDGTLEVVIGGDTDLPAGAYIRLESTKKEDIVALRINDWYTPLDGTAAELPANYFVGMTSLLSVEMWSWSTPSAMPDLSALPASLTYLDMSGNNLSGTLPASFSHMTQLTYLSVEDNQLTGAIPDLVGTAVTEAYFDGNQFTDFVGGMPASLKTLYVTEPADSPVSQQAMVNILNALAAHGPSPDAPDVRMLMMKSSTGHTEAASATAAQTLAQLGWSVYLPKWSAPLGVSNWRDQIQNRDSFSDLADTSLYGRVSDTGLTWQAAPVVPMWQITDGQSNPVQTLSIGVPVDENDDPHEMGAYVKGSGVATLVGATLPPQGWWIEADLVLKAHEATNAFSFGSITANGAPAVQAKITTNADATLNISLHVFASDNAGSDKVASYDFALYPFAFDPAYMAYARLYVTPTRAEFYMASDFVTGVDFPEGTLGESQLAFWMDNQAAQNIKLVELMHFDQPLAAQQYSLSESFDGWSGSAYNRPWSAVGYTWSGSNLNTAALESIPRFNLSAGNGELQSVGTLTPLGLKMSRTAVIRAGVAFLLFGSGNERVEFVAPHLQDGGRNGAVAVLLAPIDASGGLRLTLEVSDTNTPVSPREPDWTASADLPYTFGEEVSVQVNIYPTKVVVLINDTVQAELDYPADTLNASGQFAYLQRGSWQRLRSIQVGLNPPPLAA